MADCLRQPPLSCQQRAEVVLCCGISRLQAHRLGHFAHGLIEPALPQERGTQQIVDIGVSRIRP